MIRILLPNWLQTICPYNTYFSLFSNNLTNIKVLSFCTAILFKIAIDKVWFLYFYRINLMLYHVQLLICKNCALVLCNASEDKSVIRFNILINNFLFLDLFVKHDCKVVANFTTFTSLFSGARALFTTEYNIPFAFFFLTEKYFLCLSK